MLSGTLVTFQLYFSRVPSILLAVHTRISMIVHLGQPMLRAIAAEVLTAVLVLFLTEVLQLQ